MFFLALLIKSKKRKSRQTIHGYVLLNNLIVIRTVEHPVRNTVFILEIIKKVQ